MAALPRTVDVRAPSARRETWMVARAAFHIVYWSALVVSAETHGASRAPAAAAPSPFERRLAELAPDDQRLYRALREGAVEAERRRSRARRWPTADELAREGIPPFAPDPLDRARYTWSFVQTGVAVNYVGLPAASGREPFILVVTEPEAGSAVDPSAQVDDVHHRLADGSMIHVTIWMGPPPTPGRALSVFPPDQGYKQILGAL